MSSPGEFQRVRLRVTVKKITMNIKFPCSLTLQLRHDSPHDAKKLYELRGGECLINETIDSECDVPYNPARMRFEDKKIAINVFMVSVSGKVSAGTATFSLLGKEANTAFEQLQFLEKCPDKQAKIAYSFLFEPLRSRPDRPDRLDRTIIHELRLNERRTEEFEDHRKKTSYNSMQLPQTSRSFQQNDAISRLASRSPVQPRNSVNESQVEEVYSIGKREQSKNQGNGDTSLAVHEFLRERKEGRTRQKSKSIKKIVEVNSSKSLHHQMSFVPSPIRINTEYVTEQDAEEMEKLKGKIKNLERNDRTNVQTLRETKEEAERKRNRINQLELAKSELEEIVRIRDEKIRRLEKSMKDLQEQAEEINNQLKSSRTQSELRENITREQVKKSEDKYRQSEAEREKITEEYNRALKTYEETEKKYQNILKEKERTHHEEKGKINKKAEALALNLEDAQKEIRELKNQIDDFSRERRQLLESSNEFAIELENCKQICESLTSKLKAESDHTKQLQAELETYKIAELQKQQLKKKHNELMYTTTSLQQKLSKIEKYSTTLQDRNRELEDDIQKRNAEKNQLLLKFNQLKKNYDTVKFAEEQRIKESESLSYQTHNANTRINDLKNKLDVERRSLEEMQREFEAKYNSILRDKEHLEAENEDMKWEIEKNIATVQELNQQIRYQNEQIYKLNEDVIDRNERIKKVEEANKVLTTGQEYLQSSYQEADSKRKEQQQIIKEISNELAEYKKKSERVEKEGQQWKEKLKTTETILKEKIQEYEKRLKERDESLQTRLNTIYTLEQQAKDRVDELAQQKQANNMLTQELNHLRELVSNTKKEIDSQESLILKLKEADSEHKRLLAAKEEQIDRKTKEQEELTRRITKTHEEYNSYKTNVLSSIESFLLEMLKQDDSFNSNNRSDFKTRVVTFPDEKIANLQLEVVQKRNQNIIRSKTRFIQFGQDKEALQYEISKLKISYQELVHTYETDMGKEKDKFKAILSEKAKIQESQKENQHKLQESLNQKLNEIEQLKQEIAKSSETIQQLQSQIHIMIVQYESIKEENRQIEERLLKQKSSEIKQKSMVESKTKEIEEQFDAEVYKYRQYLMDHEKKSVLHEKDILEKAQLIKKYELERNNLMYEREKSEGKASQLADRLKQSQNEVKEYDRYCKEKERQIKKLVENVDHVNMLLREEKDRSEDLAYKHQEQSHIVLELTKELDKLREDYRSEQEKNADIQSQYKGKLDAIKNYCDKLSSEIKDLKEKNISMNSDLELKKFMIKQTEASIILQRETKEQLKSQLQKKKAIISKISEESQHLHLKVKEYEQRCSQLQEEKDSVSSNLEKHKFMMNQLKNSSKDQQNLRDQIVALERVVEKLRNEKQDQEQYYQRQMVDFKNMLKQSKRLDSSRITREEDLKKRIKTLERMLESDNFDLAQERKKLLQEVDKERRDFLNRVDGYATEREAEVERSAAVIKLNSLKQKYERENEKFSKEIDDLNDELASKDFIIKNQQYEMDSLNYRISELTAQKNKLQSEIERQRSKMKKLQAEHEQQTKTLKDRMKRFQEQEMKQIVEEIEKKMSRSRNRKMESSMNEMERIMVNTSYRELEDILNETIKDKKY